MQIVIGDIHAHVHSKYRVLNHERLLTMMGELLTKITWQLNGLEPDERVRYALSGTTPDAIAYQYVLWRYCTLVGDWTCAWGVTFIDELSDLCPYCLQYAYTGDVVMDNDHTYLDVLQGDCHSKMVVTSVKGTDAYNYYTIEHPDHPLRVARTKKEYGRHIVDIYVVAEVATGSSRIINAIAMMRKNASARIVRADKMLKQLHEVK